MIVVMQCAGKKQPFAGHMRTADGRKLKFVAHPDQAPQDEFVYAHPDDDAGNGETWRTRLVQYKEATDDNPLGLLRAFELYRNDVYRRLARHVGSENLFILSAGWGLIPADFLTPDYDITFKPKRGQEYKRRRMSDSYRDLQMLPPDTKQEVIFIGSKEYVPLFVTLTSHLKTRTIFYRSEKEPDAPGCKVVRYHTRRMTNWQYGCADDFMDGNLEVRFARSF